MIFRRLVGIVTLVSMGFFLAGTYAHASVVINEIAWMGTTVSANDEWIELYNDSSDTVSIAGWKLAAVDGTPTIVLSGSIAAGGYFLLERTDDDTVPGIDADQIFSGAIGNTGEHFKLTDAAGTVIDEVNQIGAWTAGDNSNKYTMQRKGNSWITAEPTPRAANKTIDSPPTTEPQDDQENSDDTSTDEELTTGAPSKSSTSKKVYDEEKEETVTYAIETSIDSIVVAGIPTEFKILISKDDARQFQGIHAWNFGDGSSLVKNDYRRRDDFTVSHTYDYPGTYVVTFEYYTSNLHKDPQVSHRAVVEVIDPKLTISAIAPGAYIELATVAEKEVDISGFILQTDKHSFILPENTVLLARSRLILSSNTIGIPITYNTSLLTPDKKIASVYQQSSAAPEEVSIAKNFDSSQDVQSQEQELYKPLPQEFITNSTAASVVFADMKKLESAKTDANGMHARFGVFLPLVIGCGVVALFIIISMQQKKPEQNVEAFKESDQAS